MSFRFYRRSFLNKRGHHAGAYALASIAIESATPEQDIRKEVVADLTIADCGRVTTLSFSAWDAGDARNSLHKARLLQRIVTDFADALEQAVEEAELPR